MRKILAVVTATIFMVSVFTFAAVKNVSSINHSTCVKCGTCVKSCPTKALSKVGEGKDAKIVVDTKKCIGCGTCVKVCPTKSISLVDASTIKVDSSAAVTGKKDSAPSNAAKPQSNETKK